MEAAMNERSLKKAGLFRRVVYSFVGLCAGCAFVQLWMLGNAVKVRQSLLHMHRGLPQDQIPNAMQFGLIYFIFAVAGWVIVGIPMVLIIPPCVIARLSWWILIIGLFSGPLSLAVIFVRMSHGLSAGTFRATGLYFILASVISTVACAVYYRLICRHLESTERRA
jgi:hypothetical protein